MKRGAHAALGFFFLALGAIGVVLPLLPTTPFLLLAAYFFSRSSQRLHAWLLSLPWAGDVIRDWETHKAIKKETKILAISMVVVGISLSSYALWDRPAYLQVILFFSAAVGIGYILKQKTRV